MVLVEGFLGSLPDSYSSDSELIPQSHHGSPPERESTPLSLFDPQEGSPADDTHVDDVETTTLQLHEQGYCCV